MRAVLLHESGGPEQFRLEDVPVPEAGRDEVLVKVEAVSINPVDFKTRAGGGFRDVMGASPWILGWDVAGTVAALGPGVDGFRVGDAVFGLVRFPTLGRTYAEYTAVPAADVILRPSEISAQTAAALPLVGLTAWQALKRLALRQGERLLVLGGAGGVGHVAISIARAWGVDVAATASSAKAPFLRERGALALDYGNPPWAAEVGQFDAVLNTVGTDAWANAHPAIRNGGRVMHIAARAGTHPVHGVVEQAHLVHPDAASLKELSKLVVSGEVKPFIEKVYSMTQMSEAHARLETGRVTGKLVLTW